MSTATAVWLQGYFLEAFDVAACPQQLWCFEEVSALLHTCKLTIQIILFVAGSWCTTFPWCQSGLCGMPDWKGQALLVRL